MARFVMANRRAGKFRTEEKQRSRAALDESFVRHLEPAVDVVGDFAPEDELRRRVLVFEGDPEEVRARARLFPGDVLVEPEILHHTTTTLPLDLARAVLSDAALAGTGQRLELVVRGKAGGRWRPVEGADATLHLRSEAGSGRTARLYATSDADGRLEFEFSGYWTPSAAVVSPAGGYWGVLVRGPKDGNIDLPALPVSGPLDWWHDVLGEQRLSAGRGEGIRVGVCDTGFGPHPCIGHVTDAGAFIDGGHDPKAGADVDSHGSHVCGIIGARPQAKGQYAGVAPGATLISSRVFSEYQGANQGDIANALDRLSKDEAADLINLSLGSPESSEIELDAITDALERGTLCICAAGNDGIDPPLYPARFAETVAVSALGLEGWAPDGSLSSLRYPEDADRYGAENLYVANFSNFGSEIDTAAPGVGIVSTVPERFGLSAPYGAKDGTSMASPAACAALAVLLSDDEEYLGLERNLTRSDYARRVVEIHARDIGLAAEYQGRGVITV